MISSEMACGLIIVERKYQTAMMNTVIPLIFIGWLGVAGGLIPSESGEKMGFLITVTLALVFITTQIDQNLAPAGQRSLPLISWLVLGNYLILGLIRQTIWCISLSISSYHMIKLFESLKVPSFFNAICWNRIDQTKTLPDLLNKILSYRKKKAIEESFRLEIYVFFN